MLVNENTDLFVGAVFEKGAALGTADVILKVNDHHPVHVYFNTNDYGSHFTTAQRTGARIDFGNCITQGDIFSIAEVVGSPVKSLWFTDVRYNFPITRAGWSGEFSYMYTRLKAKHAEFHEFDHLHIKSISSIAGVQATYALQRSRRISTNVYASFEYKQIRDFALGHRTSDDRLRVVGLGTDLGFGDCFGNNFINFTFYQGIPDFLGGSSAISKESSRKGAGGRFSILNLDYKRIQQFVHDFFFLINFSGQYSFNKLPIPEQFYIGGRDTVRGYPLASALGDSGYYMNWELRIPPPFKNSKFYNNKKWKDLLQFVAFVDYGGVQLKSKERPLHKGYVGMVSAGGGVRVYGPYHFNLSIDLGFPLNKHHRHADSIWYWKVDWKI
jgi:hemolysin activation/secretion protein